VTFCYWDLDLHAMSLT